MEELGVKTRIYLELYKLHSFQPGEIPMKELLHRWDFYNGITSDNLKFTGRKSNYRKGNR